MVLDAKFIDAPDILRKMLDSIEVGESTARLLREEGAPESALRRIFHFLKRLGEDGPIGSSVW